MTPSEWNSIFASLARRGTLWILVTGGEPLLRPDLPEILKNLKLNGMLYTLFTNGALIDERIIHHLLEWRPFSVEVSVYGASAETYRRITGSSEAFAKVLKGIDMLIEAGLRLELKTVLMSLNKGELDSIRKIADDRGVPFRFDTAINKSMGSGKQPELYRLEPEEIAAFDLADPERLGSWLEFMERKPGARRLDYYYHCGAGVSTFAISTNKFVGSFLSILL
jgi:MoaA/NifB/PqqE/SkfB family radical SAM enzyme